jgi:hypothetical protein
MVTEAQVRAVPERVESVLSAFNSGIHSNLHSGVNLGHDRQGHPARSSY